jgi:hypothetical protein
MASAIVQVGLSAVKDHTHTHARTQINNQISEFGRRLENRLAGPASQRLHTQQCLIFIDEALFLRSTAMRFGPAHDKSKEEKCPETR